MTEIKITVELRDGADASNFEMAMLMALKTNPLVRRVEFDCAETNEADWTEAELEQLIRLPNGMEGKITETRYLYLEINDLLNVRIPRQELAVLEFLAHRVVHGLGLVKGQAAFHEALSKFKSVVFNGEVVLKHSTPQIATSLYSRLANRIPALDLTRVRGHYGFRTAMIPRTNEAKRLRKQDPLLDPNTPLDEALRLEDE